MKKILIVANHAKEHINKFHIATIEKFKDLGWQVDVACRMDDFVPFCDNQFDLPCDRNPFRIGTFKSIVLLTTIIREGNYDVIHCHTSTGMLMAVIAGARFRKKGLKIFYTLHGCYFHKDAPIINWIIGLPTEWLLSNFIDVFITINNEDYINALRYRFMSKAILKIDGAGVNVEKFRININLVDKNVLRTTFGLDINAFVLIYVAELNKNKNQEDLIYMVEILEKMVPNICLLLVGPDHYQGKIQDLINKRRLNDLIKCLGWRNDVPNLLLASDIAVASSKSEGLGINIIESMSCGLPVVAFDNRGHREIIDNGVNGVLVKSGDIEKMAIEIKKIYDNSEYAERITGNAYNSIKRFDEINVINELLDIYKKYS